MIKYWITFFLTIIFCMCSIEIFIHFSEIESPSNFYIDSIEGKTLRKNVNLLYFNEGFYIGKTNKFGYLGSSYPPLKKQNAIRIGLFGDSFVEEFQMYDRMSLRKKLEDKLNKYSEDDKYYEVLNFGRSGYVLDDMYVKSIINSKNYNLDYNIFFIEEDDLECSSQTLIPQIKFESDSIYLDYSFLNSKTYKKYQKEKYIRENLTYPRMINNCMELIKLKQTNKILFGKLYHQDATNQVPNSLKIMNNKILKIIELLSKDSTNIFVNISSRNSHPLDTLFEKQDIKIIDLKPVYDKMHKKGEDPFYWQSTKKYGHWNYNSIDLIADKLQIELQKIKK